MAVVAPGSTAVTVMTLNINAVRAEVLFCSRWQTADPLDAAQVRFTIANLVTPHGSRWCAAQVAQEYGDHPEQAAARMRWARHVVDEAFPPRRRR